MTLTVENNEELNMGSAFLNGRCNNICTWKFSARTVYVNVSKFSGVLPLSKLSLLSQAVCLPYKKSQQTDLLRSLEITECYKSAINILCACINCKTKANEYSATGVLLNDTA
jgi:hypothetical protein